MEEKRPNSWNHEKNGELVIENHGISFWETTGNHEFSRQSTMLQLLNIFSCFLSE